MEEQQRPHTLLKLLTTTFCAQEWLTLLRRFVSELIYISYFSYANHTSEVVCLSKSFTQHLTEDPTMQVNCFFTSAWSLYLLQERKKEAQRLYWAKKGHFSPPLLVLCRFPNACLDYLSHSIRYGHEMVLHTEQINYS